MGSKLLAQPFQDCRRVISAVQVRPTAPDVDPLEAGLDDIVNLIVKGRAENQGNAAEKPDIEYLSFG